MVKQTYEFIADRLKGMKLFEKVFSYVEMIDTAQGSFPAVYIGEGNYEPVNLSSYAGIGYTRKREPIVFDKASQETYVGCEILDLAILSLRSVVSVKKELLNCDHLFGSDFLTEELFRTLSGRYPLLAECASVNDAEIIIKKTEDDRLRILQQEYEGSKFQEIPYDWMMIAIDYEVRLIFNKGCLKKFCDGYGEAEDCEPCGTTDVVSSSGLICKIVAFSLSQGFNSEDADPTGDPIVNFLLKNSFTGVEYTWRRLSNGQYECEASDDVWDLNKTFLIASVDNGNPLASITATIVTRRKLILHTGIVGTGYRDNILNKTLVKFETYLKK